MTTSTGEYAPSEYAIEIEGLRRRFKKLEAVDGLSLRVRPGRVHGFLGRNGAGKSTTIKCMLNHLRRDAGTIRVFGHDPAREEVAVKALTGYVPEVVAFYPWMTIRGTLDYAASFRKKWNREIEADLLRRFGLDEKKKTSELSKGMRSQVALICAVCPEPDLLLLDEPTSGLDPIVRREFIETVIGAYQDVAPERRTVFVSTHLINEFEGLIDEFTIVDHGRASVTMEADAARSRMRKIRVTWREAEPAAAALTKLGLAVLKSMRGEIELFAREHDEATHEPLRGLGAEIVAVEALTLEEIFVAVAKSENVS